MGKWNFSLFHLLVQVYRDLYPQVLLNGEIILSLTKTSPTDVCIRPGGGGGTWVVFGWVCAAQDSKLAPRSKKKFP